jgi:hypothetical protein
VLRRPVDPGENTPYDRVLVRVDGRL